MRIRYQKFSFHTIFFKYFFNFEKYNYSMQISSKLGHRKRLKEKFLSMDDLSINIPDYELLELLLFFSIPRCDTNDLAKDLLKEFKTINNVIYADKGQLLEVKGIGENTVLLIKIIKTIMHKVLQDPLKDKPVLNSILKVIEYARISMGNLKIEILKILFLDTKNQLISDENIQRGTVNQTPVYIREIIKRALDLGAASLIMLHNHPSGDLTPSSNDIFITKQLKEACDKLGITLHDHLIIGRYTHKSMKSLGII